MNIRALVNTKIDMESSIGGFIRSLQNKASEEDFSRMINN